MSMSGSGVGVGAVPTQEPGSAAAAFSSGVGAGNFGASPEAETVVDTGHTDFVNDARVDYYGGRLGE